MNIAPIIDPYIEDITLDLGTKYDFLCKSNVEVKWVISLELEHIEHTINEYKTGEDAYPYGSKLELTDITSDAVGEYYCINNDQIKEDYSTDYENLKINHKASSIYVFVEGKHNFFYFLQKNNLNKFIIINRSGKSTCSASITCSTFCSKFRNYNTMQTNFKIS